MVEALRGITARTGAAWWPPAGAPGSQSPPRVGPATDLYQGRFCEIRSPTLLLHGQRDRRTEPGELEAAQHALPAAQVALLDASYCPHASERTATEATHLAAEFLEAYAT